MEIPEAVVELIRSPELSFLPRYNREDIVATITHSMIDVAMTANPELQIDKTRICNATLNLYQAEFGRAEAEPS